MKKIRNATKVIIAVVLLFVLLSTYLSNRSNNNYITAYTDVEKYEVYSGKNVYEYYRSTLNDNQKILYDEIKEAYLQFKDKFSTSVKDIQETEFCESFYAVILDHPEIYWIESYRVVKKFSGAVNTNKVIHLEYSFNMKEAKEIKRNIESKYNEIINEAKTLDTDEEKVKFVHDKLVRMAKYKDYEKKDKYKYQSIVSLFESGESVCAGYAYSFKFIMDNLNIKAIAVQNIEKNDVESSHIWNMVFLDGKWYNLDVTWDYQSSTEDEISYKFYLQDNDSFYKTHKIQKSIPNYE